MSGIALYNFIQTVAVYAIPMLFAITVHEAAHGWMARRCGDRTAEIGELLRETRRVRCRNHRARDQIDPAGSRLARESGDRHARIVAFGFRFQACVGSRGGQNHARAHALRQDRRRYTV